MLTEEEELTLWSPFCNLSKEYKMFLQNSPTFPSIKNPLDWSKCIVIFDYQEIVSGPILQRWKAVQQNPAVFVGSKSVWNAVIIFMAC